MHTVYKTVGLPLNHGRLGLIASGIRIGLVLLHSYTVDSVSQPFYLKRGELYPHLKGAPLLSLVVLRVEMAHSHLR